MGRIRARAKPQRSGYRSVLLTPAEEARLRLGDTQLIYVDRRDLLQVIYTTVDGSFDQTKIVLNAVTKQFLANRTDLANHSPAGFGWGYGGSGPAQLALSLLADYLGNDALALRAYQMFKLRVIAKLTNGSKFSLTRGQIEIGLLDLLDKEST